MIFAAFEHVHAIVMECMDGLSACMISVHSVTELELRLMLQAESLSWDFGSGLQGSTGIRPRIQVSKQGEDLVIVLRFSEGGAEGR